MQRKTGRFGQGVLKVLPWIIVMSMISGCGGDARENAGSNAALESVKDSGQESTGGSAGQENADGTATENENGGAEHAGETEAQNAPQQDAPSEVTALFSGNAQDEVVLDDFCYVEGDRFIAYLGKGTKLPGNFIVYVEEIMRQEEELLGLSYSVADFAENVGWREYYFGDAFQAIPEPKDKIQIIIRQNVSDGGIEWSDTNEIMLFDEDFFPEISSGEAVYHELAHVLRLRQSEGLGQVIEEGIGAYVELRLALLRDTSCWSCIQYARDETFRSTFDDSVILEDPEGAFREFNVAERNGLEQEYQYGIRLISFLTEEYGGDVILRLSEAAAKRGDYSEKDNDVIIAILKEATSEDVFERFAKWLPDGWGRISKEIIEHLHKFGL